MAALLGPGFGRLSPMLLIGPFAFEIAALCGLLFPLVGMIRDKRHSGRAHPAWRQGLAAFMVALVGARAIAHSSLAELLYAMTIAGTRPKYRGWHLAYRRNRPWPAKGAAILIDRH